MKDNQKVKAKQNPKLSRTRLKSGLVTLFLGLGLLTLPACQAGIKLNPVDSDLPNFTVKPGDPQSTLPRAKLNYATETNPDSSDLSNQSAKAKPSPEASETELEGQASEPTDTSSAANTQASTRETDQADSRVGSEADQAATATDKSSSQESKATITTKDLAKLLKAEEFKFYQNNLITEPEPQSVVYADKSFGKAELTILYAYYQDSETADLAISKLLESDMIGKALSFGAKLDKPLDKSGQKIYTVKLNSFLANARAEMRQEDNRIGLVLLYKKNDQVKFEPYFELMELDP